MSVNRGKQFEDQIRKAFESVPNTSVIRLIDPQGGQAGICNICDFIIYHYPNQFCIECKSCYGNTLSMHSNDPKHKYGAITNTQWDGLLSVCDITGVVSGVIIWFIDHDKTIFISIKTLKTLRDAGNKSVNIVKLDKSLYYEIPGIRRRVLFDYDATKFVCGF